MNDLASDDFAALRADLAGVWGPFRLGKAITCIKSVFKFGIENGLTESPTRYGSQFAKPSKSVLRRHRAASGKNLLDAEEVRRMLKAASTPLKAMILLGINCGLGNSDIADLRQSHLNLETGWLDYPRPKTGIERRCPLFHDLEG